MPLSLPASETIKFSRQSYRTRTSDTGQREMFLVDDVSRSELYLKTASHFTINM